MKNHAFRITTDGIPDEQRLPFWQTRVSTLLTEVECVSHAPLDFTGFMVAHATPTGTLIDVRTSAYSLTRAQKKYAHAGDEHILIMMQTTGDAAVEQANRQAVLRPGDITMLDTSRAFSAEYLVPASQILLQVPRSELRKQIGDIESFTATAVLGSDPVAKLTTEFVHSVLNNIHKLEKRYAQRLTEQATELLVMAFRSAHDRAPSSFARSTLTKSALAYRGRSFIEANLRDPSLAPADVAAHLEISKRYLSVIFAVDGLSVERFIWHKRLANCARDLKDIAQLNRSIGDIAFSWGFSSLTHFSQAFKNAYGKAPREYRTEKTCVLPDVVKGR